MKRQLVSLPVLLLVLALGESAAVADTILVAPAGQSNTQAGNSSQSATNGTGRDGTTFVLGDATPVAAQNSNNRLDDAQAIGGGPADTRAIAPAPGQCVCQANQQGVNSHQVGANGDGGGTTTIVGDSRPVLVQTSANLLATGQATGGGAGNMLLIGGSAQSSDQGVNSTQSAKNGNGGGTTVILGGAGQGAASAPSLTQDSLITLISRQSLGAGDGNSTFVAPAPNQCFCQTSQQGVNGKQIGVNGDGGGTTFVLGASAPVLHQIAVDTLVNGTGPDQSIGDAVILGSAGQANRQGADSLQGAVNGTGRVVGGTTAVGSSAPQTVQDAENFLGNAQTIGGPGGSPTLVAPGTSQCFCQSNTQGSNTLQQSINGDGDSGTTVVLGSSAPQLNQQTANALLNQQQIASGGGATVLIGDASQVNQQAVNAIQTGANGTGVPGHALFIFVAGDSTSMFDQISNNALINVAVIGD